MFTCYFVLIGKCLRLWCGLNCGCLFMVGLICLIDCNSIVFSWLLVLIVLLFDALPT